jgi:hypothetical protein
MTITNYTTLQSTVADYLNRTDLTSIIPTFIQLAEAQLNRDIRHYEMEARSNGQQDAGDEYMQVPSTWLENIRAHVIGTGTTPLDLISRAAMSDKRAGQEDTAGRPEYYCMAAKQFQLYPTPDAEYEIELLFYEKIPALSASATNWLIESYPDVYLYGSLMHSAPYLQEDERMVVWAQMYAAAVMRLNESSEQARMSGSGLTLKMRGLG